MRKCLGHKTVFCCFLPCKGKRTCVCGVGWCEGSSYTAKNPRFLLSKRLGFLLYQWCGDKWFQGEKSIPALQVGISRLKSCLFSPWFLWRSQMEVSQTCPARGCGHSLYQHDGEESWPSSRGGCVGLTSPLQSQWKLWCLLKVSKSCASNYFLRTPGNRSMLYTGLTGEPCSSGVRI